MFSLHPCVPAACRTRQRSASCRDAQPQHAEEGPLACGDPLPPSTPHPPAGQTLRRSARTGEDNSIRLADRTVLVISDLILHLPDQAVQLSAGYGKDSSINSTQWTVLVISEDNLRDQELQRTARFAPHNGLYWGSAKTTLETKVYGLRQEPERTARFALQTRLSL